MAALQSPLLGGAGVSPDASSPRRRVRRPCAALGIAVALLALAGVLLLLLGSGVQPGRGSRASVGAARESRHEVESGAAAVAADDGRCSEVGAAALRAGGHAGTFALLVLLRCNHS